MHRLFEPRLVNDPFGDPALVVALRDERRALLFDLGDVAALPPRVLMRLTHVFVSHTHMDHFAGFDPLLRVLLGRKERLVLWGGPGFVDQVEHKLRAYTWNVVHRYEVHLALEVHALDTDGRVGRARFRSRNGFAREDLAPGACAGDLLHEDALLRVRARFVDHEMPCLAFALEEKARARVAKDRLAALGVSTGAWLRALKRAVLAGAPPDTPIDLRWRDRDGEHASTRRVGELAPAILDVVAGERIGYVTDLRDTAANRATLHALLAGVDRLFIESVFRDAEREHAERKNHLTARQAGEIACMLGAREVTPFHVSPRYRACLAEVLDEVQRAWGGAPAAAVRPGPHAEAARAWTRALP